MNRLPVALFIAALFTTTYALINPVHDTDIFWQIHFGRLALQNGGPIYAEPIYPDVQGRPIVPIYGLTQIWYAIAQKIGGWELIKLCDAVFWTLSFLLPAWAAQIRFDPRRGWPSATAMMIGAFAASKFYMTRPQTFAMLGFGAFLAVLICSKSFRWKWIVGTIVLVLWQNFHPSAIMGGFVAGVLAVARLIRWFRSRDLPPWNETILTTMASLAMICTPAGMGILQLMQENNHRVSLFIVTEWLPLFDPQIRIVIFPAVIGLALTLIIMILCWRKLDAGWAFAVLVLAGLTVFSHRFVVFFGIAAIVVLIQAFASKMTIEQNYKSISNRHRLFGTGLLVLAYFLIHTGRLPIWNDWFPFAGVEALKNEKIKGPIFTNTVWGGLITERGDTNWHVLYDGRYFARTQKECEWYLHALLGRIEIREIEEKLKPAAFFLMPEDTYFADRLTETSRWRVCHRDANCIVLIQN